MVKLSIFTLSKYDRKNTCSEVIKDSIQATDLHQCYSQDSHDVAAVQDIWTLNIALDCVISSHFCEINSIPNANPVEYTREKIYY